MKPGILPAVSMWYGNAKTDRMFQVSDMVRISDARMSGTSFGTIVLHVAPESAVGGPLSIVETGYEIVLNVPARSLELRVDNVEIERRMSRLRIPAPQYSRGYGRLFLDHVTQAHLGCDFDFLTGPATERPNDVRFPASAESRDRSPEKIMLRRGKFSRRRLGKSAAAMALAAVARPSASPATEDTPASGQQSSEPSLTFAQVQEMEARFKETLRRYGDRLSEEQRSRIRRVLLDNQRMLAAIHNFPLDNGDAPATTLKCRIDDASGTERK